MDNTFTVKLNGAGVSHKKMQVVARAIKNMKVVDALNFLQLQNTLASKHFVGLLKNCVSNRPMNLKEDQLYINFIVTSVGSRRVKSYHAKSRGRGFAVRKRGKSNTLINVIAK
jgi:ribosomal protein L22